MFKKRRTHDHHNEAGQSQSLSLQQSNYNSKSNTTSLRSSYIPTPSPEPFSPASSEEFSTCDHTCEHHPSIPKIDLDDTMMIDEVDSESTSSEPQRPIIQPMRGLQPSPFSPSSSAPLQGKRKIHTPLQIKSPSSILSPRPPSLQEILANQALPPFSLGAFTAFMSQKQCLENLEFTTDAHRYAEKYYSAVPGVREAAELRETWTRLIEAYIQPGAPREVNLPAQTRDALLRFTNDANPPVPEILEPAVKAIHELMNDSILPQFVEAVSPPLTASTRPEPSPLLSLNSPYDSSSSSLETSNREPSRSRLYLKMDNVRYHRSRSRRKESDSPPNPGSAYINSLAQQHQLVAPSSPAGSSHSIGGRSSASPTGSSFLEHIGIGGSSRRKEHHGHAQPQPSSNPSYQVQSPFAHSFPTSASIHAPQFQSNSNTPRSLYREPTHTSSLDDDPQLVPTTSDSTLSLTGTSTNQSTNPSAAGRSRSGTADEFMTPPTTPPGSEWGSPSPVIAAREHYGDDAGISGHQVTSSRAGGPSIHGGGGGGWRKLAGRLGARKRE